MVNAENQSENNKEIRDTSVLTDFLSLISNHFPYFLVEAGLRTF